MPSRKCVLTSQRFASIVIPLIVIAVNAYALYVVTYTVGVTYLIKPSHDYVPERKASGIAIIVIQYILFLPVALTYTRFIQVLIVNPSYIPQGDHPDGEHRNLKGVDEKKQPTVLDRAALRTHQIPFPPGYEQFSQRQVFTCSTDGIPRFCNTCWNWKPDRSHHCSEVHRCVRRFDHFCPWVGGVVSETNFKFFVQFTGYASGYALFLFVVLLWTILIAKHDCNASTLCQGFDEEALNWNWIAAIALTAMFGLFIAFGIFSRFVTYVLQNRTTIESLESEAPRTCVAVRIHEWELEHISTNTGYIYTTFPLHSPQQVPSLSRSENPRSKDSKESNDTTATESNVSPESEASNNQGPAISTVAQSEAETTPEHSSQQQNPSTIPPYAIFIILMLRPKSNIWDVGYLANIRSVMGESIIDWFVPWRLSPCINEHDPGDDISEYRLGKDFYEVEKTALPHRYDERGRRKEPLYPEGRRSTSRRKRRRRSRRSKSDSV